MKILTLIFLLLSTSLFAEISDAEKINILTDYLVKQENKSVSQARNEAIASVFGKPMFDQLSYDDDTEMFFGRVETTKSHLSRKVNFYMPKKRAYSFLKNLDDGRIEIEHSFKNNKVELVGIEVGYDGINYPMAIKSDTSMSLKIGGYFVANQDTQLNVDKNGIGGSLDLQDLFDLEESTTAIRVDFLYNFNQKHKLEASYYSLNNSNTKDIPSFHFNGQDLSGKVDLFFDTDIYKLTYIYSAYKTNKFEFMTRIGFHITEFNTGVNLESTKNNITTTSNLVDLSIPTPLPVFGLGFKYDITQDLSLKYHVDYFFISVGVNGSMVDTQIELDYMINDYIGVGLGLNSTKMDFHVKVDKTTYGLSHDVAGAIGTLIFKY